MNADERPIEAMQAEFPSVAASITDEEKRDLAELRRLHEKGMDRGRYGHDLYAAVQRGWSRRARERVGEAIEANYERTDTYAPERRTSSAASLTLTSWIREAAARGVTAEEIRRSLQNALGAQGVLRIEKIVERERGS